MNNLTRLITGVLCIAFGLFLAVMGVMETSPEYFVVASGLFFVVVGVYIIFNKKEDEVEQIKESK